MLVFEGEQGVGVGGVGNIQNSLLLMETFPMLQVFSQVIEGFGENSLKWVYIIK